MKEHNIDQLFRQKLQEHSATPSPAAWEQLAQGLHRRQSRKRGAYYAAAAITALLFTTGWLFLQPNEGLQPSKADNMAISLQEQVVIDEIPYSKTLPQPPAEQSNSLAQHTAASKPAATMAQHNAAAQAPEKSHTNTNTTAGLASKGKATASLLAAKAAVTEQPLPQPQSTKPADDSALLPQQLQAAAPAGVLHSKPADVAQINLPSTENLMASNEEVIIRYESAPSAEEKTEKTQEKVLSFLQKVKQGEIGLADVRQAKDNLFSGKLNKP